MLKGGGVRMRFFAETARPADARLDSEISLECSGALNRETMRVLLMLACALIARHLTSSVLRKTSSS